VTCPSLLRRTADGGAREDGAREGGAHAAGALVTEHAAALRTRLQQDDAGAQFARFVVVGGLSSALYAVLFIALEGVGSQPANLVGAIASTLLANELHRRLTFHAENRVSWLTAQWEAGGVTVIGLITTSTALRVLDAATGNTQPVVQVAVVATVTAVIGALRFIALRWIFRPHAVAA
jgi:putative flippase GtrA